VTRQVWVAAGAALALWFGCGDGIAKLPDGRPVDAPVVDAHAADAAVADAAVADGAVVDGGVVDAAVVDAVVVDAAVVDAAVVDAAVDAAPVCGNGVIEPGETCDPPGSCPTCAESFSCYQATGSPATCDVVCHQPVTSCADSDACCAFDGAGGCGAAGDSDCAGSGWSSVQIGSYPFGPACTNVDVYGISTGGSYVITTCVPPATTPGSGDTVITSVVDSSGNAYSVGNDDCSDPTALPLLAGWNCRNNAGVLRMSCASPSPGGFRVTTPTISLRVTICPHGTTTGGTTPVHVWYNAPLVPNPG